MKNLKKTLAVVLAFAMVLSMGFSAFAYTDVAEGTKVAEAVGILSNLGIFTGFEDGTFKPNDTVTRAQMAAIICRTLGYDDQASASTGSTNFYDVPASHWASGYINVAESLQIVNGYGNGAFGPEDQVTYEQAIKMIVVALGYELDAQAKGGWSTGYLAVAAREGITKNSNGVVGAAAVRGTIAVLVYNSLEVRLMDQKSWTPSGKEDEYGKLDETILSQYLGIRKVEGIVEAVPFTGYVANYTEDAEAEITFASDAKYFEYWDGKLEDYSLTELTYDASLIPEANNYAQKKVVAYVGEEEDDETGNLMVYAIAEKQGANKVTVLSAAQLVKNGDKYWNEAGTIGYRELGSSRIQSIDLEETTGVTAYGNFGKFSDTVKTTAELAAEVGDGVITLISNDADNKVDVILYTQYAEEAVVEEVTTDDGVVMFDTYKGSLEDIDTDDKDMLNVVIKDGVVATAADIAANDTVSVVYINSNFQVLYVSSKTVTGKVDSYNEDSVEIGGEEYELSALATQYTDTSDLSGKEGIFFLNVDGQIAHDEADAAKGNYAVVIAAGEGSGLGAGKVVEVVLASGDTATYSLKDNVILNGVKKTDDEVIDILKGDMSATENGGKRAEGSDIDVDLVFEITVKDGKITKLESVSQDGTASGKEYDEENMSYGNLSFNESTVIMSLEADATEEVQADDIKIGKVADFFVDGEGEDYSLVAYDFDNNDIAGLVIGRGLSTTIPQDGAAFVVTGYKTKDMDGDDAYVLEGFQAGKEVSYTLYNEDEAFTVADFKKGNVLLLGVASADGTVSDYEVLYDMTNGLASGIANKEDEYYYFGALDEATDKEPTNSKFYLAAGYSEVVDASENAYVAADGVVMRNSANYTLVDFSESSTPEVSKKSKGTGLFSRYASEYNYKVFVRYFEDAQVEVIVYRYAQ